MHTSVWKTTFFSDSWSGSNAHRGQYACVLNGCCVKRTFLSSENVSILEGLFSWAKTLNKFCFFQFKFTNISFFVLFLFFFLRCCSDQSTLWFLRPVYVLKLRIKDNPLLRRPTRTEAEPESALDLDRRIQRERERERERETVDYTHEQHATSPYWKDTTHSTSRIFEWTFRVFLESFTPQLRIACFLPKSPMCWAKLFDDLTNFEPKPSRWTENP